MKSAWRTPAPPSPRRQANDPHHPFPPRPYRPWLYRMPRRCAFDGCDMSNPDFKTIYKYSLLHTGGNSVDMPQGAKILAVQSQQGVPTIWALVDVGQPTEKRTFLVVGTGHTIDGLGEYVGTVQLNEGRFVVHVFEAAK